MKKIHFTGIGGSGMSALSQICAMESNSVSGSDRDFDIGKNQFLKDKLEKLGIKIFRQDGGGIDRRTDIAVVSTAVEETNPEILKAKYLGIKLIHRSRMLADYVNRFKTIAVGGTSGKSTVVAMIFTILSDAGFSPGLITGGAMLELMEKGFAGNAYKGTSDILVIEADESDGTIAEYRPYLGVILNITNDHKDIPELKRIFSKFAGRCKKLLLNADDRNLEKLAEHAEFFSAYSGRSQSSRHRLRAMPPCSGKYRISDFKAGSFCSEFSIDNVGFFLPLPGMCNAENAAAAVAACAVFGISIEQASRALRKYRGVHRRFQVIGRAGGITVMDDYAHNPAKIKAFLESLHSADARRVIAIYQPQGFAPTRHFRKELVNAFISGLGENDILFMPEIYYAGGAVVKDISSRNLVDDIAAQGRNAFYISERDKITERLMQIAKTGDIIAVMGARDPSLPEFAEKIFKAITLSNPAG
ncbi:MAG: UDP-N-acetylmuramate--alanine ligase [Elusimicrobia bacterium]|nr:UDP-N-acetylmuramate--alanine ligase [Elusimicrobiota bacterium]